MAGLSNMFTWSSKTKGEPKVFEYNKKTRRVKHRKTGRAMTLNMGVNFLMRRSKRELQ